MHQDDQAAESKPDRNAAPIRRLALFLALACLAIAGAPLAAKAEPDADVTIGGATLHGIAGDIRVFRGIPFAAPPVGPLRWRPPQPIPAATGVRDATHFGADCEQVPWSPSDGLPVSEDCLFLNVWAPAHRAHDRLPVMVFIYGGAFVGGSGAHALYDGTALARKGVVVVNFNYRLGIFGFLAHPDLARESKQHSSGNYGLLDQVAALQWVHAHIRAFGGDPGRVTIFGESAGATSVAMLMVSPLAHGLFQRAIAESPALGWTFTTLQQAEPYGTALAADIRTLRAMPASELLAKNLHIAPLNPKTGPAPFPFPIVDGWVIPHQPNQAFADGNFNRVPLIVGSNADEGTMFADGWSMKTVADYQAEVRKQFGSRSDEALRIYAVSNPAQIRRHGANIVGDSIFYEGARMMARADAAAHQPSFRYLFTRVSHGHVPLHSDELRYVFGNIDSPGLTGQAPADSTDRAVSQEIMQRWIRFAQTGNPNGTANGTRGPNWPQAGQAGDPVLNFGNTPMVTRDFRTLQLDFMQLYFRGPR